LAAIVTEHADWTSPLELTDNVKVAVRVRPFNKRELERNAKVCIQMAGQETVIADDAGNERKFTFDYRSLFEAVLAPCR
jgi:hypothetical protein